MAQMEEERLAARAAQDASQEAVAGATSENQAALVRAFGIDPDAAEEDPATEAPQTTDEVAEQDTDSAEEFIIDPEFAVVEDEEPELEPLDDEEDEPSYEDAEEEDEEYVDEAVLVERKKRLKVEKKLAYVEKQKLSADRKRWVESDAKHYPLAETKGKEIAERCTSRREFRRQMTKEHESMKPIISKILAERELQNKAEVEQTKQAVADAWGKPTTGPPVPSEAQEHMNAVEAARKTGDLVAVAKARMGL